MRTKGMFEVLGTILGKPLQNTTSRVHKTVQSSIQNRAGVCVCIEISISISIYISSFSGIF